MVQVPDILGRMSPDGAGESERSPANGAGRDAGARRARPTVGVLGRARCCVSLVATVLAVLFCDGIVPGFHVNLPAGPLEFAHRPRRDRHRRAATADRRRRAVGLGRGDRARLARPGADRGPGRAGSCPTCPWTASGPPSSSPLIIGIVRTVVGWVSTAGTNEALVGRLVASARRHPVAIDDPEITGVVFVQLDGVPYPVLHMAVMAGPSRRSRAGSVTAVISSTSGHPSSRPPRQRARWASCTV